WPGLRRAEPVGSSPFPCVPWTSFKQTEKSHAKAQRRKGFDDSRAAVGHCSAENPARQGRNQSERHEEVSRRHRESRPAPVRIFSRCDNAWLVWTEVHTTRSQLTCRAWSPGPRGGCRWRP